MVASKGGEPTAPGWYFNLKAHPQVEINVGPQRFGVTARVVGKDDPLRLGLACLLARGHLLIEDIPGVGKSTLAQALAQTLGLKYARIQFTSDLLPADVLGVSIFDERNQGFRFHSGLSAAGGAGLRTGWNDQKAFWSGRRT